MDLVTSNFLAFTTARDEIADTSRGDQDESREEERVDYESDYSAEHLDVSVFSTLTDLLFNPFLDGYCKVSHNIGVLLLRRDTTITGPYL